MYVVTVDFHIYPEHTEAFLPSMIQNARQSLALESRCRQFDVTVSTTDRNHIFLYEVYDREEDFKQHLKMPHFLSFSTRTQAFVREKTVKIFSRLDERT